MRWDKHAWKTHMFPYARHGETWRTQRGPYTWTPLSGWRRPPPPGRSAASAASQRPAGVTTTNRSTAKPAAPSYSACSPPPPSPAPTHRSSALACNTTKHSQRPGGPQGPGKRIVQHKRLLWVTVGQAGIMSCIEQSEPDGLHLLNINTQQHPALRIKTNHWEPNINKYKEKTNLHWRIIGNLKITYWLEKITSTKSSFHTSKNENEKYWTITNCRNPVWT